jgi:peptidoglycan/xylan/chitin deacetylase (PgdA/CDA1 family)
VRGWRLAAIPLLAIAALAIAIVIAGGGSEPERKPSRSPLHASTGRAPSPAPAPKARGPHDRPVPILMYHVLESAPANARYPELYVSGTDFAAQMGELARRGFHGVTLEQVLDYWRHGTALPRHPLVVSFDDGYESQYRNGFPVLHRLGWPGVVNLVTKNEKPAWGLRPAKLRKLIAAGWEIDAHTISHLDLTQLDGARLRSEVAGSRRLLRRQFGVPVNFFCYPAGRFDAQVIAAVKAAGYRGATTERPGLARPGERFTLPRVRINGTDGPGAPLRDLRALGA